MRGVKEYKQKSIVSGLKIKDILSMTPKQVSKLNKSDLQKITGRLVSAGNKRLRRAEKAGVTSSAIRYIQKTGAFSTKGKDINQLRSEFKRARNFLQAKGGTIKGARRIQKETVKAMNKKGLNIEREVLDKTLELYETLRSEDKRITGEEMKYTVIDKIDRLVDQKVSDRLILKLLRKKVDDIYKQKEKKVNRGGVSQFMEDFGENT